MQHQELRCVFYQLFFSLKVLTLKENHISFIKDQKKTESVQHYHRKYVVPGRLAKRETVFPRIKETPIQYLQAWHFFPTQ